MRFGHGECVERSWSDGYRMGRVVIQCLEGGKIKSEERLGKVKE